MTDCLHNAESSTTIFKDKDLWYDDKDKNFKIENKDKDMTKPVNWSS